jgi:uncharacterized RDD family membrane protein YckC
VRGGPTFGEGGSPTKRLGSAGPSRGRRAGARSNVIDPGALTYDIAGNAIGVMLPGLLWAALFLLAFEHGPFASSIGLGRRAFWLLLPGALAALLADLPLFPYTNDWLGISLAGALFPILVAALAFRVYAPPAARSLRTYFLSLGILTAVLLTLVVTLPPYLAPSGSVIDTLGVDLVVLGLSALVPLAIGIVGATRHDELLQRVGFLLGLTGVVLVLTFVFSAASPGLGISEAFPMYLLGPILAGVFAVLLAPRFLRGSEGLALPAAFVASTLGVLVGADVLRQPPLYPSSTPGFYVIGGAGVLDLVYLSGLLGLLAAFAFHWALGRGWTPVGDVTEPLPSPVHRLARAFRQGIRGDLAGSVVTAAQASHEAAAQTHLLLQVPEAPSDRPWQGLPVPGWVVSDQANLDSVATSGTTDGREGYRSWLMARYLVVIARELGSRRFASASSRALAFVLDLGLLTAPAVLLFSYLALAIPGGYMGLASSALFNAATVGYISVAFLYFVLAEMVYGTTVGKYALGLQVRERGMRPVRLLPSLLRNSFKVPVLSVVGLGAAIGTALLVEGIGGASPVVEGVAIPAGLLAIVSFLVVIVIGTLLVGLIGYVTIAVTNERQRWGDVVAGTWVVREPSRVPVPRAPPRAPGQPGSSG